MSAQGFHEEASLSFWDQRHIYSYLLTIQIAAPSEHNQRFPSLLGRDLLLRWRVIMDYSRNKIAFTPRTWDSRQKI